MKNLIYLTIACCTLFLGCKRDDEEVTIKGRIVKSCNNNTPAINIPIQLFISKTSSNNKTVFTDNNGFFEIKYEKGLMQGNRPITIFTDTEIGFSYLALAKGIPKDKNIDLGTLYLEQNYYAKIVLDPKKDFSEKDTFFYDFLINPRKFIVGPFKKNQVIDSFEYRHEIYIDKELSAKYSEFNYFMYQTRLNNNKPYLLLKIWSL